VKRGSPLAITSSGGGAGALRARLVRFAGFGLARLSGFFVFTLFADFDGLVRLDLPAGFLALLDFFAFFFMRVSIAWASLR